MAIAIHDKLFIFISHSQSTFACMGKAHYCRKTTLAQIRLVIPLPWHMGSFDWVRMSNPNPATIGK